MTMIVYSMTMIVYKRISGLLMLVELMKTRKK